MSKIIPFRGLRYNPEKIQNMESVVAVPFETMSEQDEREHFEKNEYNICRVTAQFNRRHFDDDSMEVADLMKKWLDEGVFIREEEPVLYIYEQVFLYGTAARSVKGVVGLVEVEDYGANIIFPHEHISTSVNPEILKFWEKTEVNPCHVWSFYSDDDGGCEMLMNHYCEKISPDIEFEMENGITQRLWVVKDKNFIESYCLKMKDKPLFIAEGHHKYETALRYRELYGSEGRGKYTMMVLTSMEHNSLSMLPIHRLIRKPNFDENMFIGNLTTAFSVSKIYMTDDDYTAVMLEKLRLAADCNAYAVYTGGDYYHFVKRTKPMEDEGQLKGMSETYRKLEISVLNELMIKQCLVGYKEEMPEISYTRAAAEAIEEVKKGKYDCAVLVKPTSFSQLREISLNKECLPKFSSYLQPKTVTGMVLDKMENIT